jgi:hypothetical protein
MWYILVFGFWITIRTNLTSSIVTGTHAYTTQLRTIVVALLYSNEEESLHAVEEYLKLVKVQYTRV